MTNQIDGKEDDRQKVKFINTGGGSFRMGEEYGRKIIKRNQTFLAYHEDIPAAFRDTIKPVSPIEEPEEKLMPDITSYKIEPRPNTKGWYDVVNDKTGKPINDKGLRKGEAEQLIEELS